MRLRNSLPIAYPYCYQVHTLPLLFLSVQLYYCSAIFPNVSLILNNSQSTVVILSTLNRKSCYSQCSQSSLPLGQQIVPHPHKKVTLCFIFTFSETAQSITECQQALLNNNPLEHVIGLKWAKIPQHLNTHKTTNNLRITSNNTVLF